LYYEEDQSGKKQKPISMAAAKLKAANFCAYQERSQKEVRNKLYSYGLYTDQVDELLSDLIVDGYVNEERFAKAFIGGKFRIKKWGRVKILQAIALHKISDYCIREGLKEIDEDEYEATLIEIIEKKMSTIKLANSFERNAKLANYAIGRGFESSLVWEVLKTKF